MLRVGLGGSQQARDVAGLMLAVAVHAQHAVNLEFQRGAKTAAQCFPLAAALAVSNQLNRQIGNRLAGAIGGAVVDHDDMGAVLQRAQHHLAYAQRLVQCWNQNGGFRNHQ